MSDLETANKAASTKDVSPPANATLFELEKLASLKERGLLSDEEFAAAKRKILGL